jgi:hypothetical protein
MAREEAVGGEGGGASRSWLWTSTFAGAGARARRSWGGRERLSWLLLHLVHCSSLQRDRPRAPPARAGCETPRVASDLGDLSRPRPRSVAVLTEVCGGCLFFLLVSETLSNCLYRGYCEFAFDWLLFPSVVSRLDSEPSKANSRCL